MRFQILQCCRPCHASDQVPLDESCSPHRQRTTTNHPSEGRWTIRTSLTRIPVRMSLSERTAPASTALRRAREIEATWAAMGLEPKRVGILASFMANFVRPFLVLEAETLGLALSPWFAPFGQFEQMVLDASSPL